jgi:small GTP-binding protein
MTAADRSNSLKVIIVGDVSTGKTTLLLRFLHKSFMATVPTLSPGAFQRTVTNSWASTVVLNLWDTAGNEALQTISPMFYRGSDVAILCYKAGGPANLRKWITPVSSANPDAEFVLAATMADSADDDPAAREAAERELANYVNQHSEVRQGFITSAKTGYGVQELFGYVADFARERHRPEVQVRAVSITGDNSRPNESGCCGSS